jgi:acyl-CoA thioesterase-1
VTLTVHSRHPIISIWFAVAVFLTGACGSGESTSAPPPAAADVAADVAQPPTPTSDQRRLASRPRIVALGDSLTAGLGLSPDEAYPKLLQQRLDAAGLPFEVVNAGVSGDTSAGGLRRLDWALDGEVQVLVVALGGNDALRGLPADDLRKNLGTIIERARGRGIDVVLAGMEAPPNFGSAYTRAFRRVYPDLAKTYDVALVPFLLDGVAGVASLNQGDGIHPTAEGARRLADNIWAVLEPIARRRAARSNA